MCSLKAYGGVANQIGKVDKTTVFETTLKSNFINGKNMKLINLCFLLMAIYLGPIHLVMAKDWSEESLEGLQEGAHANIAEAQFYLGLRYAYEDGIPRDDKKAEYWFRQAANQGDAQAQYYLGMSYLSGLGVPTDDKIAFSWFLKSAEQNNIQSKYMLGMLYDNGQGVDKSIDKSIYWYQKSALKRHNGAQFILGTIYHHQLNNLKEAYAWYSIAAINPKSLGKKAKEQLVLVEKVLSPKALEEAKTLTSEYEKLIEVNSD